MQIPVLIVLFLALCAILYFIYRDVKEYAYFKTLASTDDRQKKLIQWLVLSFSIFGIGGLLGLWVIGHFYALFEMPSVIQLDLNFDDLIEDKESGFFRMLKGFSSVFIYGIVIGIILGPLFHGYVQSVAKLKGYKEIKPKVIGDVEPLLPRNSKERFLAFWMAVNAGVSEEIFYRLLLFICLTIISNSIWIGIVGSTLLFGITHYYQGWVGVIATSGFGAVFMFLYLFTQQIWVPIALHVILDINALLVIPWITEHVVKPSKM